MTHGAVLAVSAQRLPRRLAGALQIAPDEDLQVPPLDESEVMLLLEMAGCPEDARAMWSTILATSCGGHPQLIDARVETLGRAGFPGPMAPDLLAMTTDIEAVRREAGRLIADLPSDARELIYRASLMSGSFTRDHLFAVARIEDAIAEPGRAIDLLVGPWLETVTHDRHRTSPVARTAGIDACGRNWAKAMHRKLAWTYLVGGPLTPLDVSAIMTHALVGGSMGPMVHIMNSLLRTSKEMWVSVGEACSMFAVWGLDTPPDFERPADLPAYRVFQLRIAIAIADRSKLLAILAVADREMKGVDEDPVRFFRFMFLMQLVTQGGDCIGLNKILPYCAEFLDVGSSLQETFPERAAKAGLDFGEDLTWPEFSTLAAAPIIESLVDRDSLATLLAGLEALPPDRATSLLKGFAQDPEMVSFVLDRVWLAEQKGAKDNQALVSLFQSTVTTALACDAPVLASAAAAHIIRMMDEDLSDPASALSTADALIDRLGTPHSSVLHAKAKVLSRAGEKLAALDIWRVVLPTWTIVSDTWSEAPRVFWRLFGLSHATISRISRSA